MNGENNGRRFKDDRVINLINRNFISLKDGDIKRNNEILHSIINEVIKAVKEKNEFFNDHYRNIMFVGSFYKGTKVGKPEEFDLDLIIQLPMKYETIKFEGNVPGFTKLKLSEDSYKSGWERHGKILSKWVTPDGYLDQHAFRQYVESSFDNMPKTVTTNDNVYELRLVKSGPAFTLCVKGPDSLEMSVDLVPVLEFKSQPPVSGDFNSGAWFVVPKTKTSLTDPNLYWRMSFYGLEKSLLRRNGALKPVIRQLKKLRDTAGWKLIASYHIETLFLHRIKDMEDKPELQKYSMTEHFMDMLKQLRDACETKNIINFWDQSHNLFEELKPEQLESIKGRLEKIIKQTEKDPFAIADYVLTKEERSSIETELSGYRNSGKSTKIANQQPVKANEVRLMHSKSCNMTPSSESVAFVENLPKTLQSTLATTKEEITNVAAAMEEKNSSSTADEEEKAPISATAEEENNSISVIIENKNSSLHNTEKLQGFAEIMEILKLIQSDIADTKDAVNLLTRRVAVVEDKVDVLLSRSNSDREEQSIPMLSSSGCLGNIGVFHSQGRLLN